MIVLVIRGRRVYDNWHPFLKDETGEAVYLYGPDLTSEFLLDVFPGKKASGTVCSRAPDRVHANVSSLHFAPFKADAGFNVPSLP